MQTFYGFVQTTNDALLLFEACRIGKLKRIQRRLSESERLSQVVSGSVFIWDEEESGIKRWTDGKTWSPSRIHGSFLIYKEMEPTSKRKNMNNSGNEEAPSGVKEDGLIKKALSICTANNKRQHLVSYYSREDFDNARLPIPSELHEYTSISIPSELYPEFVPETVPTVNGSMGYFYCEPNVRGIEGQQAAQAHRQAQYPQLALPSTEIVNVQPTANTTDYEREIYQHNIHYRTPPSNDYQQTQHSSYQHPQNYQSRAPSPRYLDNQPTPPQVEGWGVDRYPYRASVGHHHYAERSHPYARPPLMPNRISAGQAYGREQYLPPSPTSHARNVYPGYSLSPTSRSANRIPQQAAYTQGVYNHSRRTSGNQSIPPSPVSNQHLRQSNGAVNPAATSEETSDQSCSDNRFVLPPPLNIQNTTVDSSSSSSYFPSNTMIKPLNHTSGAATGAVTANPDNSQNLPPSPSQSQSITVTTAVTQANEDPLNQVSSAAAAQQPVAHQVPGVANTNSVSDSVKNVASITLPPFPYTKMATTQQVTTNTLSSFN